MRVRSCWPNKNKKKQKKNKNKSKRLIPSRRNRESPYRTSFFLYVWHPMASAIENGCRRDTCNIGRFILSTCVYQQSPGGGTRQHIFLYRERFVYIIVSPFGMWILAVRPVIIWILIFFFFATIFIFSSLPPPRPIILSRHVLRPFVFVRHRMGRAKKAWDDRRESRAW